MTSDQNEPVTPTPAEPRFTASHDAVVAREARAEGFRYGRQAAAEDADERERAAFERGKAEERARLIGELEARGSLLCDCAHEDTCGGSQPTNPVTKQPMDHHCDCSAVDAAATLLGDPKKTRHAAQCIHLDPQFGGSDAR